MKKLSALLLPAVLLALLPALSCAPRLAEDATRPPRTDYCELLARNIQDEHYGFVAVRARVERRKTGGACRQSIDVSGNPLRHLVIAPYAEDRRVLGAGGSGKKVVVDGHPQFHGTGSSGQATLLLGAKTRTYKTLAWVTPLSRIFHGKVTVQAESLIPGTVLRYTTDGSGPRASSPQLAKPVTIDRTTLFKLRAFGADGSQYSPYTAQYTPAHLSPAAEPQKLQPGLRYALYELDASPKALPDFPRLKPARNGIAPAQLLEGGIDVTAIAKGRPDRFALHLSGYLRIPRDQVYNFHPRGDDGARLLLDGRRVVELNTHCVADPWEAEGNVGLKKGYHRIDIFYYQDNRHRKLFIKSRPGDQAIRHPIPADAWWTDAVNEPDGPLRDEGPGSRLLSCFTARGLRWL